MLQETYRDRLAISATSPQEWRDWLAANYDRERSIWLIIFKKASTRPSVTYPEAVEEGLCWGWIDSLPNKRDGESYYVLFSPRHQQSNWSRVNKEKVARLPREERMAEPGLEMVRLAQASGTWDALNEVEDLVVPDDLGAALDAAPGAWTGWEAYPDSSKRGTLEWLFNAKRAGTRGKRIQRIVAAAVAGERPL